MQAAPSSEPKIGDQFPRWAGSGLVHQLTEFSGNGAILRPIDPRTGDVMTGSGRGTFAPLDALFRHRAESTRSHARHALVQAPQVEAQRPQLLSHLVLWMDFGDCVTEVFAKEVRDGISLSDRNGGGLGSIDQQTLGQYAKIGQALSRAYSEPFSIRGSRGDVYSGCRFLGINIASGGVVISGVRTDGRKVKKEFSSAADLAAHFLA